MLPFAVEGMKARILPKIPDLEIESEAVHTWNIDGYRTQERKVRGPTFECGGHPWFVELRVVIPGRIYNVTTLSMLMVSAGEYCSFHLVTTSNLRPSTSSKAMRINSPRAGMLVFNLNWFCGTGMIHQYMFIIVREAKTLLLYYILIASAANHRFNAEEGDWGFTRFAEIRKLFAAQWEDRGRPMVEADSVNVTAYVRIYKDPTGVLWHNFIKFVS